MAHETPRFSLTTFDSVSDTLDYRSYKFSDTDRAFLDSLLAYVAERHQHTGIAASVVEDRPAPPLLGLSNTGGVLPPGTPIYYRYGVVDNLGQEHVSSRVSSLYTQPALSVPLAPRVAAETDGTLAPGTYLYALSAYGPGTSQETLLSTVTSCVLPNTGSIRIYLPPVPSGATGFNLYRKGPTSTHLEWVSSIFGSVDWVDDGYVSDLLRAAPTANTSMSSSSVTVSPPVPLEPGQTWRVYRSFDSSSWDNTLLGWNDGGPVVDTGYAGAGPGAPRTSSAAVGSPPKIDLPSETVGVLPASQVTTMQVLNFSFVGGVRAGVSAWHWVNSFSLARVIGLRANLGRDSTPTIQPIQVALQYRTASGPTAPWLSFPEIATIPLDSTVGPRETMSAASQDIVLQQGNGLRVVVLQEGGGSTTDFDLVVNVILAVTVKPRV